MSDTLSKCCIDCKHWEFDAGDAGYSEMTPGWSWSSSCTKLVWAVAGYDVTAEQYRECLHTASTCDQFDPIK